MEYVFNDDPSFVADQLQGVHYMMSRANNSFPAHLNQAIAHLLRRPETQEDMLVQIWQMRRVAYGEMRADTARVVDGQLLYLVGKPKALAVIHGTRSHPVAEDFAVPVGFRLAMVDGNPGWEPIPAAT